MSNEMKVDLTSLTEEQQAALKDLINQQVLDNKQKPKPYSEEEKERIMDEWARKGASKHELRRISDALKHRRLTKYQISGMLHRMRGK